MPKKTVSQANPYTLFLILILLLLSRDFNPRKKKESPGAGAERG